MKRLISSFSPLLFASSLLVVPYAAQAATTALADAPLSTSSVPGNVLFTLSVEYPTAIDVAHYYDYNSGTTSPSKGAAPTGVPPFLGYFNPTTCYTYTPASVDAANGPYFQPTKTVTDSNYNCTSTVIVKYTANYTSGGSKSHGVYSNLLSGTTAPTVVTPGSATPSSVLLWSGNFLNWATMQSIDPFRAALTGGYRAVDTTTLTVLEKGYGANIGGYTDFPDRTLNNGSTISSSAGGSTPGSLTLPPSTNGTSSSSGTAGPSMTETTTFTITGPMPFPTASMTLSVFKLGNMMQFTYGGSGGGNADTSSGVTVYDPTNAAIYVGDSLPGVSSGGAFTTTANAGVFSIQARVKVCDSTIGLESNCVAHGSSYKPEGLMQKYSQKMRFGVIGYLNDSSSLRDGGVLRGRMTFVAPQSPVPGGSTTTNPNAEWDGNGVYIANPDSADATQTNSDFSLSGGNAIISSGVLNYINKFGEASKTFKSKDPVSELYYAGLRYFKHLGNVPQYSGSYGSAYGTSPVGPTQIDGFPVIQAWDDPILYACQQNFIVGIGDVNTHADGNLPSNPTFDSDSNEPTLPTAVAQDMSVNTEAATNQVATLEGITGSPVLGDRAIPWCCGDGNTYAISGLAYDAHVKDIRPNDFKNSDGTKSFTQTISTYWVDVQEYQNYYYQNQFWLAAKYGGFTVPTGWNEYGSTSSQISTNLWAAKGLTDAGFPGVSTAHPLPDHYFSGGRPDLLEAGLTAAFQSIAAAIDTTTAFSVASSKLTATNNISYSASFNPSDYTGNVTASTLSFDASGNPTLTTLWQAQSILDTVVGTAAGNTGYSSGRIIATMNAPGQNTTANPAVPFRATGSAKLSTANLAVLTPSGGGDGTNYLNYLRGSHANEGSNGTAAYRVRDHVLGDIVDSHVIAIGAPGIPGTFEGNFSSVNNPNYSGFVSAHASRATMVYVGANDGMLHAFNGSASGSGGSEIFAYVPTLLYNGPSSPATPTLNGLGSYGSLSFNHHYLVDSTPIVADVDFANTYAAGITSTASTWHSVLVSGLGKGGKGYFALDVTSADTIASETTLASDVLWEFTDANMGYSYGTPVIAKTRQYGWVVLVSSGYNNADGLGHLFVINPRTGAKLADIVTPSSSGSPSSPLGLGPVGAFVPDLTDGTVDAAYVGDLNGNMWRFDLTTLSGNYPTPIVLFAGPTSQAITSAPLIEIDPVSKHRYVLFGTGNLLDVSDISTTNTVANSTQSFYGVIDGTAAGFSTISTAITRSQLAPDSNTVNGIGTVLPTILGWYIDLPVTSNIAQRVVSTGNDNNGYVAFAADYPSGDACNPTGSSVDYAVSLNQGRSALISTAGVPIPYTPPFNGSNTSLQFVNVNGNIELLSGTNASSSGTGSTNVSQVPGIFSGNLPLKFLNWREVNIVH